ncbi:MAG: hypothetical protein WCQ99_00455 [Pseudomonadota bacterium]
MKSNQSLPKDRLQRWHLLQMVIDGHIPLLEASRMLGISYRQAKRLKQAVILKGLQGLVHGNTGKTPHNTVDGNLKKQILQLAGAEYPLLSDSLLTKKLLADHGINVSRETVRKILRSAGIKGKPAGKKSSGLQKKPGVTPPEGMMVLWGSLRNRWFGKNNPECCFMAAVDVATTKCLAARFFLQEGSHAYLWLLKKIMVTFGIPVSFCQHSSSAIKRKDKAWTIEEELRGEQDPTHTARALQELGIVQYIESKSRVESISSRFKEFLVSEIKNNNVCSIEEANYSYMAHFIERFNSRYAPAHGNYHKAWRPVPADCDIERICSLWYAAVVDANNRVVAGDVVIDVPPNASRISYVRARVELRQFLDGSWKVYYRGRNIAAHEPTPFKELERVEPKAGKITTYPGEYYLMQDADQQEIL